ncbi:MAG: helix-turn-helix domain-containing protein [Janthinobacterium lividum]
MTASLALATATRRAPYAVEPVRAREPVGRDKRAEVERVIEERLGSAMLTVGNLCRWTGMSRSSLYRLFDADGGVQAFIRARRLRRVAEDLCGGPPAKLADIAERWGFCDAAYLARVFREVHGMTPSAYRRASAG